MKTREEFIEGFKNEFSDSIEQLVENYNSETDYWIYTVRLKSGVNKSEFINSTRPFIDVNSYFDDSFNFYFLYEGKALSDSKGALENGEVDENQYISEPENDNMVVDVNDPDHLAFWAAQFELTEEDLKTVVEKVGTDLSAVSKYLQQ